MSVTYNRQIHGLDTPANAALSPEIQAVSTLRTGKRRRKRRSDVPRSPSSPVGIFTQPLTPSPFQRPLCCPRSCRVLLSTTSDL